MRMKSVLSGKPASRIDAESLGSDLSRRFALSEAEAALYLGMSRAWLKKARTARFRAAIDAPQFVKAGARRVVYRRRDLEDWLQAHVRDEHPAKGEPAVPGRLPHP